MKIIDVDSSIKLTLKFTRSDILRLSEVASELKDLLDFCAEDASHASESDLHMENVEKGQEGLELLYEILKHAEDIR